MELRIQTPFVGKSGDPNPTRGVVVAVEDCTGKYAPYPRLTLEISPGERRVLDLWGRDNQRACVDKWGSVTEKWVGKTCQVLIEEKPGEKPRRIVTPY